MKKTLLTLMCCVISLAAFAKDEINSKYGIGAVPLDENGRVYFETVEPIPAGMSQDDCYNILLNWAKGRFAMPYAQVGRILNEDPQAHRFVFHVEQTLVFKRTSLVADESRITYNFSVVVRDNTYCLKMTDIKYRYEEGREGGGKAFTAEDWITDKEAYNKKKTKFLKSTGKFRIKTIDLKDLLFGKAVDAVKENAK